MHEHDMCNRNTAIIENVIFLIKNPETQCFYNVIKTQSEVCLLYFINS